jgi:hypothetical protein
MREIPPVSEISLTLLSLGRGSPCASLVNVRFCRTTEEPLLRVAQVFALRCGSGFHDILFLPLRRYLVILVSARFITPKLASSLIQT